MKENFSFDESLAQSGKEASKTKRTWTATADNGNTISTSQTITVLDPVGHVMSTNLFDQCVFA
ncbi:MAG: hypothetical protein ACJA16_001163 [Akkermansiaceae bacterium]